MNVKKINFKNIEIKIEKIKQATQSKIFKFQMFFVIFYILVVASIKNYKSASFLVYFILFIIFFVFYKIFEKNLKKDFNNEVNKILQNDFYSKIAENLGIVYYPFGMFFIEELVPTLHFKDGNLAFCNFGYGGKIENFDVKIGDLRLEKNNKKKEGILDKIGFNDMIDNINEIFDGNFSLKKKKRGNFDGILAIITLSKDFDFKAEILPYGDGFPMDLKMVKFSNIPMQISENFSIFSDDCQKCEEFLNKEIFDALIEICINFNHLAKISFNKNKLFISVNSNEFLKTDLSQPLNKNTGILKLENAILSLIKMGKVFENSIS